jgi:hypothetical protein
MIKAQALELANFTTAGSAAQTFRLSTVVPVQGMMIKRESKECCVLIHLSAISGTSPTATFDVYETVDGVDVHVGTTGAMNAADDRVIDSGGGQISSGLTFSSGSNTGTLRLLGKGSDMKITGTTTGTIGTIAGTINVIFYDG